MEEKEKNNRLNQRSSKWHGLLWLWFIMLMCLAWSMLFSGCSTKKCLVSDVRSVSDSLVVRSSSSSVDSSRHDSSYVKVSETSHSQSVLDSVFVSQVIEKTTIIRQDSSGRELNRETNTVITNNRDRLREIENRFNNATSSNTQVKEKQVLKENTSNDSTHSKKEDRHREKVVAEVSVWQRISNFLSFLWRFVLFCGRVCIVGLWVYVAGDILIRLYRMIVEKYRQVKSKRKDDGER